MTFINLLIIFFVLYSFIGWTLLIVGVFSIARQLRQANELRAEANEMLRIKNWADS